MLPRADGGLQAAGFLATALLGFPARKEGAQQFGESLSVAGLQHARVRHLAWHRLSFESKAGGKEFRPQAHPLGRSFERRLSGHLDQQQQAEQNWHRVALACLPLILTRFRRVFADGS
jgi:hypothetical protein